MVRALGRRISGLYGVFRHGGIREGLTVSKEGARHFFKSRPGLKKAGKAAAIAGGGGAAYLYGRKRGRRQGARAGYVIGRVHQHRLQQRKG